MLIKYHDELFSKIEILKDYFKKGFEQEFINFQLLKNGLHYPDVPCGELIRTEENFIKWKEYTPCKTLFPLANLFLENVSDSRGLTEIVNSHRGRQAIGHAMTPDPAYLMMEIRQKILRRLEILYMLALDDNSLLKKCDKNSDCKSCYMKKNTFGSNDHYLCSENKPNIFWLGLIIHCIEDSYSRAHTLREYTINNKKHHDTCMGLPNTPDDGDKKITKGGYVEKCDICAHEIIGENKCIDYYGGGLQDPLTKKEKTKISSYIIKLIGDIIEKIESKSEKKKEIYNETTIINKIKEGITDHLDNHKDLTFTKKDIVSLLDKNRENIDHLVKIIQFFKQNKIRIKKLFEEKNVKLPSEQFRDSEHINDPEYPYIISFRYVPHQATCGKTFHMGYDKRIPTCEYNLESYMIKNIEDVLKMYKDHVRATTKSLDEKITEFVGYIANNIFYIKDDYRNNPSAIKCDEGKECVCNLDKKNVVKNHMSAIENYKREKEKANSDEKKKIDQIFLYQKYMKYKIKYQQLKQMNENLNSNPLNLIV